MVERRQGEWCVLWGNKCLLEELVWSFGEDGVSWFIFDVGVLLYYVLDDVVEYVVSDFMFDERVLGNYLNINFF